MADSGDKSEEIDNVVQPDLEDTEEYVETSTETRVRKLTLKGKELFDNRKRTFTLKLAVVKSDLQLLVRNIEAYSNDLSSLEDLRKEIISRTSKFDKLRQEYMDFLSRTNTDECADAIQEIRYEINEFSQIVERDSRRINVYIKALTEDERLSHSRHSRERSRSHKQIFNRIISCYGKGQG